jgi:hypothetical protein
VPADRTSGLAKGGAGLSVLAVADIECDCGGSANTVKRKLLTRAKAMGWQDLTHSDENAKYHCYRFARLISDDTGQELGLVMQFYEWGPAYALLDDCRLGPHDTFEEAQAAVEDPKKAKPLPYFSTSKLDDV